MLVVLPILVALLAPDPVLDYLEGKWTSKEESIRPDGTKVPFDLVGENKRTLGGKALWIEETLHLPGDRKAYNGILLRFDPAERKYRAWWHTDGQVKPIEFAGTGDATQLVLEGIGVPLKIEYRFERPDFYSARLLRKSGETWQVATLAQYTKSKG